MPGVLVWQAWTVIIIHHLKNKSSAAAEIADTKKPDPGQPRARISCTNEEKEQKLPYEEVATQMKLRIVPLL